MNYCILWHLRPRPDGYGQIRSTRWCRVSGGRGSARATPGGGGGGVCKTDNALRVFSSENALDFFCENAPTRPEVLFPPPWQFPQLTTRCQT